MFPSITYKRCAPLFPFVVDIVCYCCGIVLLLFACISFSYYCMFRRLASVHTHNTVETLTQTLLRMSRLYRSDYWYLGVCTSEGKCYIHTYIH